METPERWEQISEIAANAIDLPDAEREAYLNTSCADDTKLREQVLRLVSAGQASFVRLDQPLVRGDLLRRALSENRGLMEGEILGKRYRIVRHIGAGGMGDVYEAWDLSLESRVALKTVRPEFARDEAIVERFKREVHLARQVTHQNVCRVYDLGLMERGQDGVEVFCLTMELIEGQTLAELMKSHGPWTYAEALPVLEQVCLGLRAAHQAGVIHRDLKPANIMLVRAEDFENPWHVVVTDFGLAHSNQEDASSWTQRMRPGTPAYMAPEQLEGKPVGPQADLYALGGVMYEMATGQAPWQGDSPLEVAFLRLNEPVPAPSKWNPSIDLRWERVILRLLEKEPGDRYGSADALLLDLKNGPRRRLPLRKLWRRVDWRWAAVIGFVVLAACGALYWDRVRSKSTPEALRWLRQGEEAIENRSWLTAKDLLDRARAASPRNVKVLTRLAQVHEELDQRGLAQQWLLKAIGAQPETQPDALLLEGLRSGLVGEWKQAEAALRKRLALESGAGRAGAGLDLAWLLQRAGQGKLAGAALEELLKTDATHPGLISFSVGLLFLGGDIEKGEARAREARESYAALGNSEGQVRVAVERAEGLFTVKKSTLVLPAIEEAEGLVGRTAESRNSIGLAALRLRLATLRSRHYEAAGETAKSFETARKAFEEARRQNLGGSFLLGMLRLAAAYYNGDHYKEAEALLNTVIEQAREQHCEVCEGKALYNRGLIAGVTFRYEQAERDFADCQKFLSEAGATVDVFNARFLRAANLRRAGEIERGRAELGKLKVDIEGKDLKPLEARIAAEELMLAQSIGNYPEAIRLAEARLAVETENGQTAMANTGLLRLMQLESFAGHKAKVFERYRDITEKISAKDEYNYRYARVLRAMLESEWGDATAAIAQFEAAMALAKRQKTTASAGEIDTGCQIALQTGSARIIESHCESLWQRTEGKNPRSSGQAFRRYSRAHFHLARGEAAEAMAEAAAAFEIEAKPLHPQNQIYCGLLALEGARRLGDERQTALWRARLGQARARLEAMLGPAESKSFWTRPTYRKRWLQWMDRTI